MTNASGEQGAAIRSYFDASAAEYVAERERQHSFIAQRDLVLSILPERCARVLDLGCGPAMMAGPLLERSREVWGVDASERMIALGEARMGSHPERGRLHLRVGTAERLPFPEASFDAVVAMGVLEYVWDRASSLAEIRRVLRPGGVVAITVPSAVSAYHLARRAWVAAREAAKRALGRSPSDSQRFLTRRCVPWRLDRELAAAGLARLEGRFCNFILFPLHELLPAASAELNRRLSELGDTPFSSFLGTQYVVSALRR
ncbi:MAG: class I SAM-dependent methyltransferase [Betaproteobacteria bacterium]|nr:class I SAM-dependent methyltransferase [Betaproteobacteria bacterium]